MSIKEKALNNFSEKKYNCCQAVICAYCEEYGIDDRDIFKMTEGFGGGIGGMQDICGAVSGALMAISMHNSAGDKENPTKTKADTYGKVFGTAKEFEQINGSIYCRDLKKMVDGVQVVSCQKCVETGAELVEKYIEALG